MQTAYVGSLVTILILHGEKEKLDPWEREKEKAIPWLASALQKSMHLIAKVESTSKEGAVMVKFYFWTMQFNLGTSWIDVLSARWSQLQFNSDSVALEDKVHLVECLSSSSNQSEPRFLNILHSIWLCAFPYLRVITAKWNPLLTLE